MGASEVDLAAFGEVSEQLVKEVHDA